MCRKYSSIFSFKRQCWKAKNSVICALKEYSQNLKSRAFFRNGNCVILNTACKTLLDVADWVQQAVIKKYIWDTAVWISRVVYIWKKARNWHGIVLVFMKRFWCDWPCVQELPRSRPHLLCRFIRHLLWKWRTLKHFLFKTMYKNSNSAVFHLSVRP